MKRAAESQLTKDSRDEENEEEVGVGFKKADPTELSERRIRSLPKRGGVALTSVPTSPDPTPGAPTPPVSRFGGFTGFGASGSTSNPFSLIGTQPSSSPPFGVIQTKSPFTSTKTASNSISNPPSTSNSQNLRSNKGESDAARKYYLALHGLNKSFIHAATEAVSADPFTDIADLLGKYKSFRESAQKEFEANSSAKLFQKSSSSFSSPETFTSKTISSMPSPPASFSSGFKPAAASGEVPSGGINSAPTDSHNPPASFSFGLKTAATPFGGFKPTSTASGNAPDKPLSFSFVKDKPDHAPFVFGNSAGNSLVAPSTSSDNKAVKADASALTPLPTPLKLSATSDDSASVLPKPGAIIPSSASPSGFGFGTSKASGGTSPFGSFGNGSIGNPVGFSFASPPSTPQITQPATLALTSTANPSDTVEDTEEPIASTNPYDVDGPGEESESTVYETKCSAHKFALVDGKRKYVKVGTGLLKLKRHNDTGKRRLLMRNSSTGNIILNFSLHAGFAITVEKKDITFRVPGEGADATIYRLRLTNEADATKWPTVVQED